MLLNTHKHSQTFLKGRCIYSTFSSHIEQYRTVIKLKTISNFD